MLEIKPDIWSHSSDYFETMLEMAEKLLKESKAFVDDTDTETMRKEREERVESKNRNACKLCESGCFKSYQLPLYISLKWSA